MGFCINIPHGDKPDNMCPGTPAGWSIARIVNTSNRLKRVKIDKVPLNIANACHYALLNRS